MTRDLNEVIKSQQTMIGKDPDTLPIRLLNSYQKLLKVVYAWKDREPGIEMIYINYKNALNNTELIVDKVIHFLGRQDFDKEAMIASVDNTLYRNKSE